MRKVVGFSMAEARREKDKRAKMSEIIAEKSRQNSERLLQELLKTGLVELKRPQGFYDEGNTWATSEDADRAYKRWRHNCHDLVSAVKNHRAHKLFFTPDWQKTGILRAGVIRN